MTILKPKEIIEDSRRFSQRDRILLEHRLGLIKEFMDRYDIDHYGHLRFRSYAYDPTVMTIKLTIEDLTESKLEYFERYLHSLNCRIINKEARKEFHGIPGKWVTFTIQWRTVY